MIQEEKNLHPGEKTVRDGLAIVGKQAQVAPDSVDKQVDAWLKNLSY